MANKIIWSIDPIHSEISFKVRHLMIASVQGEFKKFGGSISTDDNSDFTSANIYLWINTSSITTGSEQRDENLKGIDFFNVIDYSQITFTSTAFGKCDELNNHELWGELTIKGQTRAIKLLVHFGGSVIDEKGKQKAGFCVTGKINRAEWSLVWNAALDTGGLVLSDEVIISCEIELIKIGEKIIIGETVKQTINNAFL